MSAQVSRAPADRRAQALADWIPEGRACFALAFDGCAPDLNALTSSDPRVAITALRDTCLAVYCEQLEPTPALCADPRATKAENSAVVIELFEEFLAAKLAHDYGVARDEPRVVSSAQAFAPMLSAPLLLERATLSPPVPDNSAVAEPAPASLALTVEIHARGFTVEGRGIERETIAARAGSAEDYQRYDYDALTAHARALKRRFAHESVVHLRADETIPMQVLINTMDALRGEGCEGPGDAGCLFAQPIVEPPGSAGEP